MLIAVFSFDMFVAISFCFCFCFEFLLNSRYHALHRAKHMVFHGEGIVNREKVNLFLSRLKNNLTKKKQKRNKNKNKIITT